MAMTTQQISADFSNRRVVGLDTLRIVALILVTWQHAASVLGAYAATQWRGISPGQTGVAIFCAISGYLAFHTTPRSALDWLMRRLRSIFPSYWMVTIIAFAMVIVLGTTKSVTIGLFVSQMLGLGFFTHGWELVNVVSWFVSLILLCYALAFLARQSGYPLALWVAIAFIALLAVTTRTEVVLSRHILAFALGALYGIKSAKFAYLLIGAGLVGAGLFIDSQLFYSGLGLLALNMAALGFIWEPHMFRRAATYSYEYFLVHGICLVATSKVISNGAVSTAVAVTAAAIAAVVLYHFERYIFSLPRMLAMSRSQ